MAKVLPVGKLTDVHTHKHGHANIATYIWGQCRVDYYFVSPRIIYHVLRCVFEAFHARKVCDHRDYFVHLSMIGLFDRRLPAIVNLAKWCIRNNHLRLVRKYILKLAAYFDDHNIVRKVTEIQHEYSYKAVEKLDELVTAGMLCAEKVYRNDARLPWSEEIHEKMTQVNILWLYMSSLRNKGDRTNQVEQKQHTLKVKQDLPITVKNQRNYSRRLKNRYKNAEWISIQNNNIIRGSGRGIHCKLAQYVSRESN